MSGENLPQMRELSAVKRAASPVARLRCSSAIPFNICKEISGVIPRSLCSRACWGTGSVCSGSGCGGSRRGEPHAVENERVILGVAQPHVCATGRCCSGQNVRSAPDFQRNNSCSPSNLSPGVPLQPWAGPRSLPLQKIEPRLRGRHSGQVLPAGKHPAMCCGESGAAASLPPRAPAGPWSPHMR